MGGGISFTKKKIQWLGKKTIEMEMKIIEINDRC
jgi:hypothetical protein